jgi:hypothetical protein
MRGPSECRLCFGRSAYAHSRRDQPLLEENSLVVGRIIEPLVERSENARDCSSTAIAAEPRPTPGGEGRSSIVNSSRRGTLFVSVAGGGSGPGTPLLADCPARPQARRGEKGRLRSAKLTMPRGSSTAAVLREAFWNSAARATVPHRDECRGRWMQKGCRPWFR